MRVPESEPLRVSLLRLLGRSVLILLAAALVVAPAYWWLGPPLASRLYGRDEFGRFAPTIGHGVGQVVGETLLSLLVIWVARRWLRVRL